VPVSASNALFVPLSEALAERLGGGDRGESSGAERQGEDVVLNDTSQGERVEQPSVNLSRSVAASSHRSCPLRTDDRFCEVHGDRATSPPPRRQQLLQHPVMSFGLAILGVGDGGVCRNIDSTISITLRSLLTAELIERAL
jgi:hypothetical protein